MEMENQYKCLTNEKVRKKKTTIASDPLESTLSFLRNLPLPHGSELVSERMSVAERASEAVRSKQTSEWPTGFRTISSGPTLTHIEDNFFTTDSFHLGKTFMLASWASTRAQHMFLDFPCVSRRNPCIPHSRKILVRLMASVCIKIRSLSSHTWTKSL